MTIAEFDEQRKKRTPQVNYIYLFILSVVAFSALFLSVINLQMVEGSSLTDRANQNQVELTYRYPLRGVILDRDGKKLAENIPATNLLVELKYLYTDGSLDPQKIDTLLAQLDQVLGANWFKPRLIDDQDIADPKVYMNSLIAQIEKKDGIYAQYNEILLVSALNNDQTIKIKSDQNKIEGIRIEEGNQRSYPGGESFSHILGYTSMLTAEDLEYADYLGYEELAALNGYKDMVGRIGVEATHDKFLTGKKGIDAIETDALGNITSEVSRSVISTENGKNLHLSISYDAQQKMYQILKEAVAERGATGGAGILQDVESGELIALASYPSFNNNDFVGGIDKATYDAYLSNPRLPLLNRTISAQLPPGSTFKTIAAVAGLDSKKIDKKTIYVSRAGYTFSNGAPFQEYRNNSYGALNVNDAISVSSNIFFCEMIRNWDINKLTPYYERFGIGTPTGVDLQGETAGRLPSPENKIALSKIPGITWLEPIWYPEGDGCNTVIGQGITLVTPLQMSNWIAAIANGGTLNTPHIGVSYSDPDDPENLEKIESKVKVENIASVEAIKQVQDGMRNAVAGPRKSINALTEAKVPVAAKTGTAEFGALNSKGEYEHTHAWVTGFFPYENPKYSFVLLLEDGGESYYAAQEARKFIDWWVENGSTE